MVDKDDYIKEVQKEVRDNDSYEETDCRRLKEVDKDIKKLPNRMHNDGHIDLDLKTYLIPKYPKNRATERKCQIT